MFKFGLFVVLLIAGAVLILTATAVAGGEVPPPYEGMKNPFSWGDTSAQTAGRPLYQQSCGGCHGARGNSIPASDFSTPDFRGKLEEKPDYYFWLTSEGRLANGMPPFKSSLSESQRWQVLTFIWSLGASDSLGANQPPASTPTISNLSFRLTTPEQAQAGQELPISASLKDTDGKPVAGALVMFFLKVDFFASGLAEIDSAYTDSQGIANVVYGPRLTGEVQVYAIYEDGTGEKLEAISTVMLNPGSGHFYESEVGLRGGIGPPDLSVPLYSDEQEKDMGFAPGNLLRIPGGLPFYPFMGYVAAVVLVWGLYMRIMYQVLRVPRVDDTEEVNTRLVPVASLIIIGAILVVLVFILVVGPESHPHLRFG
ncbi:MAG: c-type cytochrome [Dehalococcoidia bacterium]|nr:c-type cytochrome [Dehalococcoidia bacterium]